MDIITITSIILITCQCNIYVPNPWVSMEYLYGIYGISMECQRILWNIYTYLRISVESHWIPMEYLLNIIEHLLYLSYLLYPFVCHYNNYTYHVRWHAYYAVITTIPMMYAITPITPIPYATTPTQLYLWYFLYLCDVYRISMEWLHVILIVHLISIMYAAIPTYTYYVSYYTYIMRIMYTIEAIITKGPLSGPGYRARAIGHRKGIAHPASHVSPKFRIWCSWRGRHYTTLQISVHALI